MPMLLTKLMASGVPPGMALALGSDVADSQTAAGTTQLTAHETSTAVVRYTTVASGAGSLLDNGANGDSQFIVNDGANTLAVYPHVGGSINGLGTNAAFSIPAGAWAFFDRITNTRWVAGNDAANSTFLPSGTGAVASTVQAKIRSSVPLDIVVDFGADPLGVADSTTAIQNALNDGRPVYFPAGTFKTTATLNLTTAVAQGIQIYGAGPVSNLGAGTNKAVIKPSSAVTVAFKIDGTGIAAVQNSRIHDFSLDMTNMTDAATTFGFRQVVAFGGTYDNIKIINDGVSMRGWKFEGGSLTTTLNQCRCKIIEFNGNSLADAATTTSLNDCDMQSVIANNAAAITVNGGTIQGSLNKFVLSNINGFFIHDLDVEGTGTYLAIGAAVNHLYSYGNELSGFSGTYSTGTPGSAVLNDFGGQAQIITNANGFNLQDTPLTNTKSSAGLHRTTFQNSNAAAAQVDLEFKSTPAGGSAYFGQTSGGKATMDSRGGTGAAMQLSGTDIIGFDGAGVLLLAGTTSGTASAGAATLPANPVGFLIVTIGGTARKIPYYAT